MPHVCSLKKYGRNSTGMQRWRCRICGKCIQQHPETPMNQIDPDKDQAIRDMLGAGKSTREIAKAVGVSKVTVERRRDKTFVKRPILRMHGPDRCDWCGEKLNNRKEWHRRTARTKHKFCNQECYVSYMNDRRKSLGCLVCGGSMLGRSGGRGMCGPCYTLARIYGFDLVAAQAAKLTHQLRKEIINVKQRQD